MDPSRKIITIDGPAGAGKSTLAKRLAAALTWTYLDTGAMYRAVGLAAYEAGADVDDKGALAGIMAGLELRVAPGPKATRVFLGDREVTGEIREPRVSSLASRASAHAVVRRGMVDLQRKIGRKGAIVAEGRDMGTVVFPDARVKFFLVASLEERARRRYEELVGMGETVTPEQVKNDMARRDADDSSRDLAPLIPADEAELIDSTGLSVDEVLAGMLESVRREFGAG